MKRFLILLLALSLSSASADVTTLNLFLGSGQSWTVPQGQTAIVTHAVRTGGATVAVEFRVLFPGTLASQFAVIKADGFFGENTNTQPMYFGAGTIFENPTVIPIMIVGRLAEAGDLFASAPSEMETTGTTETTLQAKVTPAVKRPAKVTLEESTNLLAWNPSPSAIIQRTIQGDYITTLNKDDDSKKYVRATVKPRRQ